MDEDRSTKLESKNKALTRNEAVFVLLRTKREPSFRLNSISEVILPLTFLMIYPLAELI